MIHGIGNHVSTFTFRTLFSTFVSCLNVYYNFLIHLVAEVYKSTLYVGC